MNKKSWAGLALVAGFALLTNASDVEAQVGLGVNADVRADIRADVMTEGREFRGEVKEMRGEMRQDIKGKIDAKVAELGVQGVVTAVSGTTLTVSGKPFGYNGTSSASTTYSVDASGAKVRTEAKTENASLTDISVGDMVHVTGVVTGQTVVASMVLEGNVKFKGGPDMGQGPAWASTTDAWKPRGFFGRIGGFFRGLFGGKAEMKTEVSIEAGN